MAGGEVDVAVLHNQGEAVGVVVAQPGELGRDHRLVAVEGDAHRVGAHRNHVRRGGGVRQQDQERRRSGRTPDGLPPHDGKGGTLSRPLLPGDHHQVSRVVVRRVSPPAGTVTLQPRV